MTAGPASAGDATARPAAGPTLDLLENPFTRPGSRLLVQRTADGDALQVRAAVFERAVERCRLATIRVLVDGRPCRSSGAPAEVRLDGGGSLVFADDATLSLALPDGGCTVELETVGQARLASATGAAGTDLDGTLVAWRIEGAPVDQVADRSGTRVRIGVGRGAGGRLVVGTVAQNLTGPTGDPTPRVEPHDILVAREAAWWTAWMARRPAVREDLAPMADLAWWTLGANQATLAGHGDRPIVVASKLGYVAAWQWDSYFVAAGLRHGAPELAWDQVALFLDHQAPDGQLPDVVSDEGVVASVRDLPPGEARPDEAEAPDTPITKPPLGAWAAWAVHERLGDLDRLAWALPRLAACHRWWDARSDANGDGLAEYLHRFSSGLDDSPLFDVPGVVEPPDLNSYLVVGDDRLARMAALLGRPGEAAAFADSADARTGRLVAQRWDARRARFRTMRGPDEVDILTPFALMPLLTGRLPGGVVDALTGTLTDSRRLWTANPVPTVAIDEPSFDADHMWRGPVWLGVNRLLVAGLEASGQPDIGAELAERTLAMVARSSSLYEHWHATTGGRPSTATTCFSWSAAMYLDLAVAASR